MAKEDIPVFDPAQWQSHAAYLYGIDLHNHGYYWECHEALEGHGGRFHACRTSALSQGLIQLSAAHSHALSRSPDLGVKLANWALDKWASVNLDHYAGINLSLQELTKTWQAAPATRLSFGTVTSSPYWYQQRKLKFLTSSFFPSDSILAKGLALKLDTD